MRCRCGDVRGIIQVNQRLYAHSLFERCPILLRGGHMLLRFNDNDRVVRMERTIMSGQVPKDKVTRQISIWNAPPERNEAAFPILGALQDMLH